ncbi:hypothetical protein [Azospirillum sp. TSO22-1]|uniref:hypothetical protein n=1 Tax=Azospirillum sp. TSO22-1 TaxID=716789 RepID=UPI000D611B78|nr:hypothetical protein [Azospirillum sp. TSO22-1]PWC42795.1 hypothetical protein TSO221_20925 [Azospirillum sp. TSO22-1]
MWRLLIVVAVALLPLGLSHLLQGTGVPAALSAWLPRVERPAALAGQTPPPEWRERAYLTANPDVAAAVRRGAYESGYQHYRLDGLREGRSGGFPAPRDVAELPER